MIALRASRALVPADLVSQIKPKFKGTILEYYFGTVTWFWEIRVKKGNRELVTIAARVPADPQTPGANDRDFVKIVEEDFIQ